MVDRVVTWSAMATGLLPQEVGLSAGAFGPTSADARDGLIHVLTEDRAALRAAWALARGDFAGWRRDPERSSDAWGWSDAHGARFSATVTGTKAVATASLIVPDRRLILSVRGDAESWPEAFDAALDEKCDLSRDQLSTGLEAWGSAHGVMARPFTTEVPGLGARRPIELELHSFESADRDE